MKIEITMNAVTKRVNRRLAHRGQALRTVRGDRGADYLGRHYIIDIYSNAVVDTRVDPLALGRELGVVHECEVLPEE